MFPYVFTQSFVKSCTQRIPIFFSLLKIYLVRKIIQNKHDCNSMNNTAISNSKHHTPVNSDVTQCASDLEKDHWFPKNPPALVAYIWTKPIRIFHAHIQFIWPYRIIKLNTHPNQRPLTPTVLIVLIRGFGHVLRTSRTDQISTLGRKFARYLQKSKTKWRRATRPSVRAQRRTVTNKARHSEETLYTGASKYLLLCRPRLYRYRITYVTSYGLVHQHVRHIYTYKICPYRTGDGERVCT